MPNWQNQAECLDVTYDMYEMQDFGSLREYSCFCYPAARKTDAAYVI